VFEAGQVDLPERALVGLGTDLHAAGFLVVGRKVLHRGTHAPALYAPDQGGTQLAADDRVLGEVLEVAPAQRGSLDVDTGTEENRDAGRPAFRAERLSHFGKQVGVPR
jgi:hypothetical protein